MCWPPLIDSVAPVMKSASSATRNITPRAMSSARPKRPMGMRAMIFSSTGGGTALGGDNGYTFADDASTSDTVTIDPSTISAIQAKT